MNPRRLQDQFAQARSLAENRRWEEAERIYARLAEDAVVLGHDEVAHGAFAAAGDAAFRADFPRRAIRHLRRALDRVFDHPVLAPLRRIQLAAMHGELGDLDAASRFLEQVGPLAGLSADLAVLFLDTHVGLLLSRGRVAEAVEIHRELEDRVSPALESVAWFRDAQIAQSQGRLTKAEGRLHQCIERIQDDPRFDGPLGAVWMELAEIALLRGRVPEAMGCLGEAGRSWEQAKRLSSLLRVEGLRVRCLARLRGCEVLTQGLRKGIAFAEERGLLVLEIELRAALGASTLQRSADAAEDLGRALLQADAAGIRPLAGRIRLMLHDRPDGDLAALEQAGRDLEEVTPWLARVLLAQARLAPLNPQSISRCGRALCRFTGMGMEEDALLARELFHLLAPAIH